MWPPSSNMCTFLNDRFAQIAKVASVDVAGAFDRGRIHLHWSDTPRPTSTELDAQIDETWEREMKLAERTGAVLFNGDLVRYAGHWVTEGVLHIDVGSTDYKAFIGTNLRRGCLVETIGRERFANAMGVSAIIVTRESSGDNQSILLGLRSKNVVDQPHWLHTFGGALEASDRGANGAIDVFAAVMRELCEELGIRSSDVTGLSCLGLVHDHQIWQPELVFAAHVALTGEQIRSRMDFESPGAEHEDLEMIADTPESLASFILESTRVTPVALTALCLHGRERFGESWCK